MTNIPLTTHTAIWLKPNRRALYLGAVPVAVCFLGALAGVLLSEAGWMRSVSVFVLVLSGCLLAVTVNLIRRPRLAYRDRHLLVYLRPHGPIRMPIEVVECFFLGQGPSLLPTAVGRKSEETSNIIVRLAEAAAEWKHLDVTPSLGLWCDGYITIRGAWCEPIRPELVKHLNERLVEAHRQLRAARQQETG